MLPAQRGMVIVVLFCLYVGCALFEPLTPQQQAVTYLQIYKDQYNMYWDQLLDPAIVPEDRLMLKENPDMVAKEHLNPDLTDDQIDILSQKRKILIELKKPMLLYEEYLETGQVPPVELQNQIEKLIDQLISLVEG